MKLFKCQNCGHLLYFENTRCESCAHRLGYAAERNEIEALEQEGQAWKPVARDANYRFCANAEHDVCNWLVQTSSGERFCAACRHNGTVPDLAQPENLLPWRKIEDAKHRLFYSLMRLRLPLETRAEDPENGLVFDFLADPLAQEGPKVMTGHDNGRITIALVEADDAEREKRRASMGEPYRTLLGHFRHEVGHYYWDRLIRDGGRLAACRAVFGDERQDYAKALKTHYQHGPPANWRDSFISTYATTHPWEDFAETWAHYLHIIDALEMAGAFGMRVGISVERSDSHGAAVDFDPYEAGGVQQLVGAWHPLTLALNSISLCMGQPNLYPFVLSGPVIRKLEFVHDLIRAGRTRQ